MIYEEKAKKDGVDYIIPGLTSTTRNGAKEPKANTMNAALEQQQNSWE